MTVGCPPYFSPAVEGWVADLKCDGVSDGWPYGEPEKPPKIPDGYRVRTLFWD